MALINCKECGNKVSTEAKSCPQCGAKPQKRTSVVTWAFLILLFVIVFKSCESYRNTSASKNDAGGSEAALSESRLAASKPDAAPKPNWQMSTSNDSMTSKEIRFARTSSTNFINQDFPYTGDTYGNLTLRKHPKWGTDVMFSIDRGQFVCRSYDGCSVSVRFDDGDAVKYHASEPDDHSSTMLFISPSKKFIEKLRTSKTLNIQATIYKEGSQVFTFKTGGLDWDSQTSKK